MDGEDYGGCYVREWFPYLAEIEAIRPRVWEIDEVRFERVRMIGKNNRSPFPVGGLPARNRAALQYN